ncbi:MAG: hypothetical protein AB8G11_05210 [Saprospiraceae bacterium]
MKQLFLFLLLISCCGFSNICKGQIDTLVINKVGVEIFEAFKKESTEHYQQTLMAKSDYRNIIRKTKWDLFPKNKFKEGYNFLIKKEERQFNLVVQNGAYQEINWSNIEFEKFIFHSEETQLINQTQPEPAGFMVNCHLVFKIDTEYYTIVGIELLKCGKDYKVFHSPEGVYPIRLEKYVAADSINLDKNGRD